MLVTCPKCSAKYEIPGEVHLSAGRKMKCSACQHVFLLPELSEAVPEDNATTEEVVEIDPVGVAKPETSQKVFADGPVFQDDVPQPFVPVSTQEVEHKRPVNLWATIISVVVLVIALAMGVLYRDTLFEMFFPAGTGLSPLPVVKKEVKEPVVTAPVKKEHPVSLDRYVEETPEIVPLPQIQSVRFEKRNDPQPTIRIEGVLKNAGTMPIRLPEKVRAIAYNLEGAILFEKEIYLTDLILPAGEERLFFGSYQPAPEGVQWVDVTF